LPGSQNIAVFARRCQPEQFRVSRATNVRRGFTPERTPGDEEFLWNGVSLHLVNLPLEEFAVETTARSHFPLSCWIKPTAAKRPAAIRQAFSVPEAAGEMR